MSSVKYLEKQLKELRVIEKDIIHEAYINRCGSDQNAGSTIDYDTCSNSDRVESNLNFVKVREKKEKLSYILNQIKEFNYDPTSQEGCHVVKFDAPWIVGVYDFDINDYDCELEDVKLIPDISVDFYGDRTLSVINTSDKVRTYYISIGNRVYDKNGQKLSSGVSRGTTEDASYTTLIILAYPRTVMEIGTLDGEGDDVDISSDIKDLETWELEAVKKQDCEEYDINIEFPLVGDGPFLCSQGFHGQFTHFYPATRYAIDLNCDVGTEIIAVGDGKVLEIKEDNTSGGVHVDHLYKWNSIMLQLVDRNLVVEYVHIQQNSCTVKVGDSVKRGQVICKSGDVGFCPTPHLHVQIQPNTDPSSKTLPFSFNPNPNPNIISNSDTTPYHKFVAKAGYCYNGFGLVCDV